MKLINKIDMILRWSQGDLQYHEEAKHNAEHIIPNDIYEKTIELCKIPTQTLDKVKELEERVQIMAKIALTYEKVKGLFLKQTSLY